MEGLVKTCLLLFGLALLNVPLGAQGIPEAEY